MREEVSSKDIERYISLRRDNSSSELVDNLYADLCTPSYVHGYSLAIEYMYKWFEKKFDDNFFKSIYVDGKHVLDDYKKFSKLVVKGENPRARIEPRIQFDYDREYLDTYFAPPEVYLKRSATNESFFKDVQNKLYLAIDMKALRMDFNFKIRVNTRAQQLDLYNRILMYFRIGSTMHETINVDFHVPKYILLSIAETAGFAIENGEVVDIIEFINYLNAHSEVPFLFKLRAINQKPEFFIRVNDLYTHISCVDRPSVDDGERDGKLDFNFHIEFNAVLTIPIPHFYAFYSAKERTTNIKVSTESKPVAIYSIAPVKLKDVDEHGWNLGPVSEYMTDKGDEFMDLSQLFSGNSSLAKAINHDLTRGISPSKFINIKVYYNGDVAKHCPIRMDWKTKKAYFNDEMGEDILHIAVYYDREYINTLDIEINKYNNSRLSENKH